MPVAHVHKVGHPGSFIARNPVGLSVVVSDSPPQSHLDRPSEKKMLLLTRVVSLSALCAVSLGCPTIVSRSQWGAWSPKSRASLKTPVPYVIIHHTAGNRCTSLLSCTEQVKGIQNYHVNKRGWSDIGYNFLIGEDGRVYEGRGWSTVGAHAKNWNSKSLGLSFLGTFTNGVPSTAALNAARSLIRCAVSRGFLSPTYTLKGHRNVSPTSCPGNALYGVISRFLIGEDGRVYEGRGWSTVGAHASGWNSVSLGFSFLGTFSSRTPNAAALNAAQDLIQCAVNRGSLSSSYTLKGHRNVNSTKCPGNALYNVITQWPRFQA
ncbi:peptidoglycan-recognition protein SC2-like [Pangshura tecta]